MLHSKARLSSVIAAVVLVVLGASGGVLDITSWGAVTDWITSFHW